MAKIGNRAEIGESAEVIKGIFIQPSRHSITWTGKNTLSIGCINQTFDQWLINFEEIGKKEKYTDSEILEYKMYIDLIIKIKS